MPVRTPGSISTCGTDDQYCSSITRISCSTDGTVDSPVAPVSRSASSPINPSMVSASSSAVTSASVRIRQCCTTFAWSPEPEISPTTVWVLRTSIASSTALSSSRAVRGLAGVDAGVPVDARRRADVDGDVVQQPGRPSRAATSRRAGPSAGAGPSHGSRTSR